MNKALRVECSESQAVHDKTASEVNEFVNEINAYMNNALHSESSESQTVHGEIAVVLNVQEFSSGVVDKAENFIAAHSKAASNIERLPIPMFSPENVESVKSVEAKKDVDITKDVSDAQAANGDTVKQIDRETFLAQAREIAEQSQLVVSETTLEDGRVIRLIRKGGLLKPEEYAEQEPPKPLIESQWAVESIAKMLEIMALSGESFEDLEENDLGVAMALIKKYDLWKSLAAEQGQTPAAGSTVNTAGNVNTNEKSTGYIPQATDPAQLGMSGSEIKFTADNEITAAAEQKTAAYYGGQGKIISRQNAVVDFIPVDSQTMRAMYKQESGSVSASEKEPASAASNIPYSQQNAKAAVFEGAQIPVSYTELSNAIIAQQAGLTAETQAQPVQNSESSAQMFSQQVDANAAKGNSEGVVNLALVEAAADVESSDSQDTLQINTQANAAKAIEAAEKALSSLSRVDQQAIIEQITEKLQTAVRNGVHEMRITLRPQELGEVRMNIRVEGDQVTARMMVESEQVKAVVEKHFQQLKDALEQQNLHAAKLSVDVGTDADRRQLWQEMASMANQRRSNKNGSWNGEEGGEEGSFDFVNALGVDTGRRYGNNTFEFFV